jgi:predicted phage tail protein
VYGEVRKGGSVTYLSSSSNGKELFQVVSLTGHEVESIEEVYLNDEVATLSPDGYDNGDRTGPGFVTSPRRWSEDDDSTKHEIRVFYHTGNQDSQSVAFSNSNSYSLSSLITEYSNLTLPSTFVGEDISYLFIRYAYEADVFDEGLPVVTAKLKGKKVYDPRTETTAYSNNAALCIRDFLTSAYGLNDSEIDDISFSAAANICDEDVSTIGGGTEKRYTINGVVRADQSYGEVLQRMVTACGGTLFWGGGKWKLVAGEYNAPTKNLTLDDLRSNINLQTKNNLRDQFNRVQGTFVDQDNRYIATDYPPVASSTFLSQDGGVEQPLDLDLPFTTSSATAQRLAKLTLFRGREQMVFSADFGLNAFDVEVGEIISLTMGRYGWDEKEFEVVGWNFNSSSEGGDLRVSLTLRETSAAAFSWTAEEQDIISNDTTLFPYNTNVNILNLSVAGGGRTQGDGTFINSAILSWDEPDNSMLSGYEIQWKATADSTYNATNTTESGVEVYPLVDGVEYTFRVRAKLSLGRFGPYSTITFTGGGDDTAPGPVTSFTAEGAFQVITLRYTPPTDSDWDSVNVYESTTNQFSNASIIGTSASDVFYRLNLPNDTTRYYWIETVDFSGNTGTIVGPQSATTQLIEENDFSQALQDTLDQAGVEAVNSLPASGSFEGQLVLLLTDFTFYRWDDTASEWTSSLYTAIEDNSVTTNSLVANAVVSSKIAAGAVTADKISVNQLTAVAAEIGTFQSAASGARLKISDDVIEVYDASGNLRVKLGNLA